MYANKATLLADLISSNKIQEKFHREYHIKVYQKSDLFEKQYSCATSLISSLYIAINKYDNYVDVIRCDKYDT